jgi:hypothetical protein
LLLTVVLHGLMLFGWYMAVRGKAASGPQSAVGPAMVMLLNAPLVVAEKPAQQRRVRRAHRTPQAATRRSPLSSPAEIVPTQPAPVEVDELERRQASTDMSIIARAKRDVGKIDRELRGGKSGVPAQRPDTPIARFEALMASAFIDRSTAMSIHTYRSADGVAYTRLTRRGAAVCYMGGGGTRAVEVNCPPADSGWLKQ